jgi:hypothetical protein
MFRRGEERNDTVELSHEGRKVDCFEGTRENVFSHELGIGDHKGSSGVIPTNIFVRVWIVYQSANVLTIDYTGIITHGAY